MTWLDEVQMTDSIGDGKRLQLIATDSGNDHSESRIACPTTVYFADPKWT